MSEAMFVTKRNGSSEPFYLTKIHEICKYVCNGLNDVDAELLANEVSRQVYPGIHTDTIYDIIVLTARTMMVNEDPNYSYVAARTLLLKLNREVVGKSIKDADKDKLYRAAFVDNIKLMVEEGLLSDKLLAFDLEGLSQYLKLGRDNLIQYPGAQTLYDRYFINKDGRRLESLQGFFMRVAIGLSINEKEPEVWAKRFYDKISLFKYLPSTPTLFNAGTNRPQLSSCFVSTVPDDLEGIFGAIYSQAMLSKWAGGLSVDWSYVRGLNSHIKGTNGKSQGVVPWMKVFNDTLVSTNQGGKRKGSGCSYLETGHIEIEEFLELRKNTGDDRRRTHDMNTANWIPDLFMKRVINDDDWMLSCPSETRELHDLYGKAYESKFAEYEDKAKAGKLKNTKTIKAKSLWRKMLTAIVETGHPWMCFKDPCNIRYPNKHVGIVHNSNLCSETAIHNTPTVWVNQVKDEHSQTAVCNLASPNLAAHIKDGKLDWVDFADTLVVMTRGLDNVIDINFYPIDSTREGNFNNRFVGAGLMGLADVLQVMDIEYDSLEAINFSNMVQEFLSYYVIKTSCELAKERGTYPTYKGSEWDKGNLPVDTYINLMKYRDENFNKTREDFETFQDWNELRELIKKYGMRNSNLMATAPTATISTIAGCSSCTEPIYSVLYTYSTMSGELPAINTNFVNKCKELGIWNKQLIAKLKKNDGDIKNLYSLPQKLRDVFKTAFEVNQFKLIDAAAARQVWIDQSQSTNLFYAEKSLKKLSDIYIHAWRSGLKTTYYLRSKGASRMEKVTVDAKENESGNGDLTSVPTVCSIEAARNGVACESCQ